MAFRRLHLENSPLVPWAPIVEGWVLESLPIHGAAAGDFINHGIDEVDLGHGIGAFGEVVREKLLVHVAIQPTSERMNCPRPYLSPLRG